MIRLNDVTAAQVERAGERARDARLFVQPTAIYRMYRVTNRTNGQTYTVQFFVRGANRYGTCTCPATVFCKHLLAAGAVHMHVARVRVIPATYNSARLGRVTIPQD